MDHVKAHNLGTMRGVAILAALVRMAAAWSRPDRGARLVEILRAIDGAWIKIGQTASFRRDLLPADVCDALAAFQGSGGAASIGVVRREGHKAIKEIPLSRVALIHADLRCLRRLALAIGWLPVIRRVRLSEIVGGVIEAFSRELDLRLEASSMRAFRKQLKGRGLYVPLVYACDEYRLEMEYIEGEDLGVIIARGEGPKHRKAARKLFMHLIRMILEDNRFHGDPHPGNVRVMPNGKLALLDFGCVGVTDASFLRRFRRFVLALDDRDWRKAANEYAALQLGLVPRSPFGRILRAQKMARVERALIQVLDRWAARAVVPDLPFHEHSLNALINQLVRVVATFGGHLNVAWLSIQRALQAIQPVMEGCCPRVNYLQLTRRYCKAARRRAGLAGVVRQLLDMMDMGEEWLDRATDRGIQIA